MLIRPVVNPYTTIIATTTPRHRKTGYSSFKDYVIKAYLMIIINYNFYLFIKIILLIRLKYLFMFIYTYMATSTNWYVTNKIDVLRTLIGTRQTQIEVPQT